MFVVVFSSYFAKHQKQGNGLSIYCAGFFWGHVPSSNEVYVYLEYNQTDEKKNSGPRAKDYFFPGYQCQKTSSLQKL